MRKPWPTDGLVIDQFTSFLLSERCPGLPPKRTANSICLRWRTRPKLMNLFLPTLRRFSLFLVPQATNIYALRLNFRSAAEPLANSLRTRSGLLVGTSTERGVGGVSLCCGASTKDTRVPHLEYSSPSPPPVTDWRNRLSTTHSRGAGRENRLSHAKGSSRPYPRSSNYLQGGFRQTGLWSASGEEVMEYGSAPPVFRRRCSHQNSQVSSPMHFRAHTSGLVTPPPAPEPSRF